jgi:hypothetical protein
MRKSGTELPRKRVCDGIEVALRFGCIDGYWLSVRLSVVPVDVYLRQF